jgi:hypothetical protein
MGRVLPQINEFSAKPPKKTTSQRTHDGMITVVFLPDLIWQIATFTHQLLKA